MIIILLILLIIIAIIIIPFIALKKGYKLEKKYKKLK